jgi:hypothetical protein
MTQDEGFPETIDPDSTADERPEDELDPPALPGDEPRDFEQYDETESIDARLAEEEPEPAADDRPLTPEEVTEPPVRPHPESEVSMYDTEESTVERGGPAEEAAIHETDE